jgi:oxaloacetate decarboxylase (Na+ extruding) subunit alpha
LCECQWRAHRRWQPPAPIDPDVKDRVLSSSRANALKDSWQRPDKTLDEVREEYGGRNLSDEELFRRHFAPVEDIEAARAAGPVSRNYKFSEPLSELITGALQHSSARRIRLESGALSVDLRR